ncbi:MAG TPA: M4 family metallopeptidase [Pseudomonadota bacterium]|nr:M4 family metallopeptidase [Pseudomonadota bacterium]
MRKSLLLSMVSVSLLQACGGNDQIAVEALSDDGQEVSAQAISLIQLRGTHLGLDSNDVVRQRSRHVDELGHEHVRFERSYRGLPVKGGDFVVHTQAREDETFSAMIAAAIPVSQRPDLTPAQAHSAAKQTWDIERTAMVEPKLVVHALGEAKDIVLAYEVVAQGVQADGTPSVMHTFVDASSGRHLTSYDEIETGAATGSGRGINNGSVSLNTNLNGSAYELVDTTHGNSPTINLANKTSGGSVFSQSANSWGDGTTANAASAGVDAHYGATKTWDYYKTVHGRNGIANDGKGAQSRVHYSTKYNNAYWSDSCFCMTYGDGDGTQLRPLVALDVAGHEMSHGVTSRTANLVYSGESGGLNEATSDIFGTAVEFYAGNSSDPGDYLIGEKIMIGGKGYLRNMMDPTLDGASVDNYSKYKSSLDVHYSSGIANNFFYLLSEGGKNRTSGKTVTGIGRAKAEKIWYRALTVYMTSSTNYKAARTATLNAAKDLYGSAGAEYAAVGNVWTAVGVN